MREEVRRAGVVSCVLPGGGSGAAQGNQEGPGWGTLHSGSGRPRVSNCRSSQRVLCRLGVCFLFVLGAEAGAVGVTTDLIAVGDGLFTRGVGSTTGKRRIMTRWSGENQS